MKKENFKILPFKIRIVIERQESDIPKFVSKIFSLPKKALLTPVHGGQYLAARAACLGNNRYQIVTTSQ